MRNLTECTLGDLSKLAEAEKHISRVGEPGRPPPGGCALPPLPAGSVEAAA